MRLDVDPPLDERELEVLCRALWALEPADGAAPAGSAWWRAGVHEVVGSTDADDEPPFYPLSPRKTRGATRA